LIGLQHGAEGDEVPLDNEFLLIDESISVKPNMVSQGEQKGMHAEERSQ
jgi:hypothetical protein